MKTDEFTKNWEFCLLMSNQAVQQPSSIYRGENEKKTIKKILYFYKFPKKLCKNSGKVEKSEKWQIFLKRNLNLDKPSEKNYSEKSSF